MPFARAALRPWRFTDWQLGVALLGRVTDVIEAGPRAMAPQASAFSSSL